MLRIPAYQLRPTRRGGGMHFRACLAGLPNGGSAAPFSIRLPCRTSETTPRGGFLHPPGRDSNRVIAGGGVPWQSLPAPRALFPGMGLGPNERPVTGWPPWKGRNRLFFPHKGSSVSVRVSWVGGGAGSRNRRLRCGHGKCGRGRCVRPPLFPPARPSLSCGAGGSGPVGSDQEGTPERGVQT